MVRLGIVIGPLVLALWVYCLVTVISSRDDEVRNLPRVAWILIVLLFPLAGSVAWLIAGRPIAARAPRSPYERSAQAFPEYDRPGRFSAPDPDADEAFLRQVRERAEAQRQRAREQRRATDEQGQAADEQGQPGEEAAPGRE